MMFQRVLALALAGSCLAWPLAPARAQSKEQLLPLRRVRLYEAGVAYFERSGVLGPTGRLPVPRSQLDDALKTLVVFDIDGKAAVSGIELEEPLTRAHSLALANLPAEEGDDSSFDTYLQSLLGARVELSVKASRREGVLVKLLSAEHSGLSHCVADAPAAVRATGSDCAREPESAVLLLTEQGELQRHGTSEISAVRPLEAQVAERLRGAARAQERDHAETALSVKLRSGRAVTLGYVAEAPLWRSSYRLLLSGESATLQGWALIHNDSEEGWHDVQIELVNGQPDSFLFPMAAPRYATRRLVTPDEHLSSVPQLLGRTPDDAWDGADTETSQGYGAGGLSLGGFGASGGGRGIGVSDTGEQESSLLQIGNLAAQDPTNGQALGALFRYALTSRVELAAHRSLLVPFLKESVRAERIAWFEDVGATAKSTIVLTNTSAQTLPPGTIALFEGGGFAGESAIGRWEPQVRRFVHFGQDLDVALEGAPVRKSERLERVSFAEDKLSLHSTRRSERQCTAINRGSAPRRLHLKLAVLNNSRVTGADAVFVDSSEHHVDAVFALPPATRKNYELVIEEALSRSVSLEALNAKQLALWLREPALGASERAVLGRVLALFERHEAVERQRAELGQRIKRLEEHQQRLTSTLELVRRADPKQGERQARELVAGESERTRLKLALDQLASDAPLVAARREFSALP